uniref:ATM serine/threonine kinase n=1 Tax=Astyanax mexicanus TaxID=7994 RepID=A0A8B9JDI4_ASTMX
MSLSVHELLLCCRGLENEKATERKKEIDRFKRLLRDPETVKELDRTSALKASRNNNQLTWDAVFRNTFKRRQSSFSQTHICGLIFFFFQNIPLKCSDLLAHVVEVMQSSFSCSAYGEDYSSMLLKNILSVRKYWCEITQQQWHTLLELYCGLFTGTSKPINRVLVSRIIHTVVQGCCLQTEGLSHTLFNFFSRALSNTREERQLTILEHLISALNVFLRSVAINCRRRVCRLGEELLPSILYVWSQKRPSSTLKEEMVEFFNLQMCVHHPKGAKTLETGNDAPKLWQSLLYNLYDALVSEISQIGSRGKYATGARHIAVKENLIELTADICHQVINRYIHSVTDLQYSLQRDSPQSSKRRRVELGWEVLRDHLQPQHNDFDMIPWLQVTAALTSKYPSMLPAHELLPLLSLLGQLLGEQQRRGERRPYVLRCLRQVALCQAAGSASVGTSEAQQREVSRLWSRVWAMAVRGVSSAQTEGLCLELLRTMVQCSLVPVDREFWKLFSAAICKPSTTVTPPAYMVHCLKLLTGVLGAFVCVGVITEEDACHSSLFHKAKRNSPPEDLPDESFNRRATLLKSLSVVMCCSPVCEKQALFALFQSYKENGIEEQLIKKVLGSVSRSLGYRSSKAFVCSHLYYLVAEWLSQRETDPSYTLQSFPYTLLNYSTLEEFYRSSYHVLIPHLVFLNDFEQVRSIGSHLQEDWKKLLGRCFPKLMVNILPHFALPGQDAHAAQQREKAHRVYDLLKDNDCLGKQQIDNLICSNLADIVVELLMTLYEGAEGGGLQKFIGELDPAPNPPFFNSKVIKATLDYLSNCHSANHKSLVTILSKTPMSIQKILASICERAAETTNAYERHRILMMYHLFVNLLLQEVKDGLGGAWAFVLRDIIYTLIHQINSRSLQQDEVSTRSLALCCDLLTTVCKTAVLVCDDALESHLQVIVGTLTAQVTERPVIVLHLLKFLVIDNPDNRYLRRAIPLLEPFPDRPAFRELRAAQHQLKYSSRTFSLRQEIDHFLSVASCDSLPLTRLEGLKDLKRQLHTHKQQMEQLLKECHGNTLIELSHFVALEAVGGCLGELGPVDLSTIALHHGKDQIYTQAAELFPDALHQWIFIILSCINNALTHHSISIRQAAAQCLKDVLATQPGLDFWEKYKSQRDPMLLYLSPFRSTKRKVMEVPLMSRDRLDSLELWSVNPGSHKDWLRRLCIALLDSGGIQNEALLMTRPLCEVKTDFCQRVLPLFIHNMLLEDRNGSWRELLSTHIQRFFSLCSRPANPSSRPTTPLLPDSGPFFAQPDKCSLRTMLAVIDYLRKQSRPLRPGRFSNFWLDLNYLEVARAAQLCSAHFTALLYSEIYVDNIRSNMEEKRRITFDDSSQNLSIGSVSEKSVEDSGISLQDLLIDVYRSIGEPDSLYGCGGGKLINPLTSIHVKIIFKLRLFSLFCRSEKLNPGFNESLFTALQALKDKDFFVFEEALKYARGNGVEELCRGNLEAVSSLYPTLCSLQMIEELQSVKLAERAVFQMKQRSGVSKGMSTVDSWAWQLEEAQVFWVKKEEGLALALLRQMIDKLEDLVDINPAVVPVYSECLRLCGSWLSETCLESPAVILESYLERAVEAFEDHGGAPDPKQQSQMTQAFLSLARFSDAQYQGIENYMRSSEFENKQALLEKAKEEVDLMKERNVTNNRYTVKVQRELELDVRALANLRADRRRFLLKAVENYIRCLELGEEHDTWIFRLASLWLENADVKNVNDMMKEGVKKIPSYKFLPLMYQLAARMGTKLSNLPTQEEAGFHSVLNELICRASMDHPHHTLFIILALVNANKDESFSRSRLSRNSARQPSPLDLERAEVAQKIINVIRKQKAQMIQGIETLCSAYITLAYMDASRHKTEKSELILLVLAFNKHAPIPLKKKSGVELDSVKKLKEAQRMEFDKKLQAFTEVCQNFRPVFRYFCMERFLDPAVWLEKRLAYTRSVATSSIVGYIVGLGDRHIQNILIDEQTAELVHIDLGVAFEQGKILPTPETVPFRLSRDIVDGMGITGVEGVFRRCCEKTMEVMRSSQEVLLTIVEVCAKVCRHLLKAEIGVIRREKHPLLQEKLLLFWIGFILNCRTFRVN